MMRVVDACGMSLWLWDSHLSALRYYLSAIPCPLPRVEHILKFESNAPLVYSQHLTRIRHVLGEFRDLSDYFW